MPNSLVADASGASVGSQRFANGTLISKVFVCPETGYERTYRSEVKQFEEVEGRRLYWVKYGDGDTEHMSERQVQKSISPNVASKPFARLERKRTESKVGILSSRAKRVRARSDDGNQDRKMKAKRQRRLHGTPSEDVQEIRLTEVSQEDDPVSASVGKPRVNDASPKEAPTVPVAVQVADNNEKCPICEVAPMKKPRASPCHHIFCKACIQGYYSRNGHFCPLCRLRGELRLTKRTDSPAFKPVEALNMLTGEVVHSFSSASAASMQLAEVNGRAMMIMKACRSRRRDDRAFAGYYWRFKGSTERILRSGEGVIEGRPIEQVCLETDKVLNVFLSIRKADETTGVCRNTIRRVLNRRGKANGGGFFWRFVGQDHTPWPDPEFVEKTAVEQLSLETGEVLASFRSIADAKRCMGIRKDSGCIRECCNGQRRSVIGFFFRWKGSASMPLLKNPGKRVQLSKTKGGKVWKEFPSAKAASDVFGVNANTASGWCREEQHAVGYWWRYDSEQPDPSPVPPGGQVVGRRLRLREGGEWIEGKLVEYHGRDDSHSIQLDRGDVTRIVLSKAEYELKNDQGQKSVEQLDKDTGEVLNTFPSINAARRSVGSVGIFAVLNGKYDTSGGFFWRYKGSNSQPRRPRLNKVVEQLCLKTGSVLATHKSISAAGKAVDITFSGISGCCNGRKSTQSAGGFGWRFANEKAKTES